MKDNNKIVYFGASGCAEAYIKNTGTLPDFFVDNDKERWDSLFHGIKVMDPNILKSLSLEKIIITTSFLKDVYPQILSMGISEDKIYVPPKSMWSLKVFEDEITRIHASNKLYQLMQATKGYSLVAVGGTALGFNRDNDFIHWDDDIDLFAPDYSRPLVKNLFNELDINFKEKVDSQMQSIIFFMNLDNGFQIDASIDFFDTNDDKFIDIFEDYKWEWPTSMFTDCQQIEIHGNLLNIPNPPDVYLSKVYGPEWFKPNINFGYEDYTGKK